MMCNLDCLFFFLRLPARSFPIIVRWGVFSSHNVTWFVNHWWHLPISFNLVLLCVVHHRRCFLELDSWTCPIYTVLRNPLLCFPLVSLFCNIFELIRPISLGVSALVAGFFFSSACLMEFWRALAHPFVPCDDRCSKILWKDFLLLKEISLEVFPC